jgi:hypothetical protein
VPRGHEKLLKEKRVETLKTWVSWKLRGVSASVHGDPARCAEVKDLQGSVC